jgi:regulator of replication initiation timing
MTPEDRIAELEAQVGKLQAQQADLREQLARAQLDLWQGRIENLELRMHLGAMKASAKLAKLMNQLRDKCAVAQRQFKEIIPEASSVADTVRTGLEDAFDASRKAFLESKNKLT